MARPKIAVHKFASCDGCQLTFLDCEDELLEIARHLNIAYFLEATSSVDKGPYDISFVEGSITTEEDAARIRQVREISGLLITIGACATAGGIQAIRNTADESEFRRIVYAHPDYIEALATSTPVADHVKVDLALHGCPISKAQLLDTISALLAGRAPRIPRYSQCLECKSRGTECVMVARGVPCLGPVTRAGCGNLCPSHGRGCYGCFGPSDGAETGPLAARLADLGLEDAAIRDLFRGFASAAPAFATEARAHD